MTEVSTPFFSIVIPTYNRADLIGRALKSVLNQTFDSFEIIVVDDGSNDNTSQMMVSYNDTRLHFLQHPYNRGVCPARNTGVDHARGEWVVFLDSDDELVPTALNILADRANHAPKEVARLAGMYRWDDGGYSPIPKPSGEILNYEGYIRWSNTVGRSDFHNCIKRSTFEKVRFPDGRAYETIYHLDFAAHFQTWLLSDVVALAHQDADNRVNRLDRRARARRLLRDAPDGWGAFEQLISIHGSALQQWAPQRLQLFKRTRILLALLSGKRGVGLRHAWSYSREYGLNIRVLGAVMLCMVTPRLLAWAQVG